MGIPSSQPGFSTTKLVTQSLVGWHGGFSNAKWQRSKWPWSHTQECQATDSGSHFWTQQWQGNEGSTTCILPSRVDQTLGIRYDHSFANTTGYWLVMLVHLIIVLICNSLSFCNNFSAIIKWQRTYLSVTISNNSRHSLTI